jgi:lipoate-protein ligase A
MVFSGSNDSFFNMGLDEVFLLSCQDENSSPILRLYQWNPPGISLGYFQSIGKTIDVRKCQQNGIDFVRRITGGRAVLHENELTYSICASEKYYDKLGKNVNETYQKISFAFIEGLKILNIKADWVKPHLSSDSVTHNSLAVSPPCFSSFSRYEITVLGKKLIGSAQGRFKNSFIQHGSLLLGKGNFDLSSFLPFSNKIDKRGKVFLEKSTNIEDMLRQKVELKKIIEAIKTGFERFFEIELIEKEITREEKKQTLELKEKKYSSKKWNYLK